MRTSYVRHLLAACLLVVASRLEAGYAPGCTVALDLGAGALHEASAVALQPDGRIVVAGYVSFGFDRDFLVARYHPDLTLDTSFNGTGWVATNFDYHDQAFALAIQTDGKIVVVGSAENSGASKRFLAVARYLPDGSLDPTFVGGGAIRYDLTGGSAVEELFGVTLQRDGKIVGVGYHTSFGVPDILVTRFLKDGNWDNTFNGNGYSQPIVGDSAMASDVEIDPIGNVVVSATGTFTSNDDFVALRLRPDGSLDSTFAGTGWTSTDIANPDDDATAVVIDVNGNVVLAGTSSADIALVRYLSDGTLDTTFDFDGVVLYDIGTDAGRAMELDASGNMVVVGEGGATLDFALTRFDSTGTNNLAVTTDVLSGDRAFALRVRRDGKLVVAGTTQIPGNPQLTLALYNSDGTQDCGEIALHPAGDGASTGFTFTGCPANWDCTNDQPSNGLTGPAVAHDGLTTYVSSASATSRDLYRLTDPAVPPGRVITEIEIVAQLAWNGTGATPSADLLYQRQGFDSTPIRSTTLTITNTSFQEFRWRSSDLNWTSAELNALEIGVEHVAGDGLRLTQIYVIVTFGLSPLHPVDAFTAAATGDGSGGQITLNWLNPAFGLYDETVIRKSTTGCPTSSTSDAAVVNQSDGLGQPGTFVDNVSLGSTYYYAAFVEDAEDHASPGQCVVATPFDRTVVNKDWIYSTSDPAMALATPGVLVSANVVYTATNDGVAHAMTGGSAATGGGAWPAGWKPYPLGAAAPNRPPVVQLPSAKWAALFAAKDGHVYAIDAATGELIWRSVPLGMLSSSPAAILSAFGSVHDLVFIGTRDLGQPNHLYALDAADGTIAWEFDNGGPPSEIGIITSGATVSYADERVYFTSFAGGTGETVWCLDFSTGTPATCGSWPGFGVPTSSGGDVDASPVLFNNFVLVSDQTPGEMLYGFNPNDGTELSIAFLGNGGARDYVFPQFGSFNVIASTASELLSLNTSGLSVNWVCTVSSPSAPLQVIGTSDVYAGGGDGKLHRLSTMAPGCPGTFECIGDCSTTMVGSPAYDHSQAMIYVGTDDGEIYGVKTPF